MFVCATVFFEKSGVAKLSISFICKVC